MTLKTKAPVLFISHGAPTFAIEPNILGPQLNTLGQQLTDISAVLVVSPHWQTRELSIMTTASPKTIHDFGGFPAGLYKLNYPAPGHPQFALETEKLLAEAGWRVSADAQRGLDHGAWVPLLHLLPDAKTPVFQVSMPYDLSAENAFKLGQALAPMRNRGVLIMGSGSITHNLHEFRQPHGTPADYILEFTDWVREAVRTRDIAKLVNYRSLAPHAHRAHPTEEHFISLLVAIGASSAGENVDVIPGGVDCGILSMESYAWGHNK